MLLVARSSLLLGGNNVKFPSTSLPILYKLENLVLLCDVCISAFKVMNNNVGSGGAYHVICVASFMLGTAVH